MQNKSHHTTLTFHYKKILNTNPNNKITRQLNSSQKQQKLVAKLPIDENEKKAVQYIFDVLNSNMLNDKKREQLLEVTKMLNPRYEYQRNEGKQEGKLDIAKNLSELGIPIDIIIKATGLTETQIKNAK